MYFEDYPTATKQRSGLRFWPIRFMCLLSPLHVWNNYLSAPENSWLLLSVWKKNFRLFLQQRLSAAPYTLPVHNPFKRKSEFDHILIAFTFTNNVQNKQFDIRRSHFCRIIFLYWRVFPADVKMFVVSFTFAIQKSTNKKPKQNSLLIILSSCFH